MRTNYPYLKDSSFLKEFSSERLKEQYVKITVLTFSDEKPIKEIQGYVTGGTCNLDGSSSVRRTCNLSMVAPEENNDLTDTKYLLSINKKIFVEIGFKNTLNKYSEYNILWFPLGIYVITNPSISHSASGLNISLQLKDKMCLLNGECGGVFPASVILHEYETMDSNGSYYITRPVIYQIIQELVNHFGGEQMSKIIIKDVPLRIKQVMKWNGITPLYVSKDSNSQQMLLTTNAGDERADDELDKDGNVINSWSTTEYVHGDDIGYIYTDFTCPDGYELIASAGSTVCEMLDKIKNLLGNYEYFYDIYGNFIFQEIKNYLNTSKSTTDLNNINYQTDLNRDKAAYAFEDGKLFTSFSNSPNFNIIKNDFVIWGKREDVNGNEYPIRYHIAIDSKPKVGNTYSDLFFYQEDETGLTKVARPVYFDTKDSFPEIGEEEKFYYDESTGYIYKWVSAETRYEHLLGSSLTSKTTTDWRDELYFSGLEGQLLGRSSNYYWEELKNEWPKLYDVTKNSFKAETLAYPQDIDFFLDFIDSSAAISEISVNEIGRRTKVLSDDSVNCIFEPEIPNLVLIEFNTETIEEERAEAIRNGERFFQVPTNIYKMLAGGGRFNSAYNLIRQCLHEYTKYHNSITINSIPMFFLEPNTRINVRDNASGIYGDYMINSISLPLDVSGTMTLSCSQAIERI